MSIFEGPPQPKPPPPPPTPPSGPSIMETGRAAAQIKAAGEMDGTNPTGGTGVKDERTTKTLLGG